MWAARIKKTVLLTWWEREYRSGEAKRKKTSAWFVFDLFSVTTPSLRVYAEIKVCQNYKTSFNSFAVHLALFSSPNIIYYLALISLEVVDCPAHLAFMWRRDHYKYIHSIQNKITYLIRDDTETYNKYINDHKEKNKIK